MKISHVVIAITLSCSACFLIKENPNDPDRMGITVMSTPVYEGMVAVMAGTKMKELPPQTVVYVLRDSLTVSGNSFVGISWNDSIGYVPVGWLLLHGKPALLDGAINERVMVFSDANMTIKADSLSDWQIVSVVESEDASVRILYARGDKPVTGYIRHEAVSTDSLNFEFFKVFRNTDEQPAALEALSADSRFTTLSSFQTLFPTQQTNENDSEGENIDEPFVMEWRSKDGKYLNPDEYPGEFAAYLIFGDSSQSKSSAFGASMSNGYEVESLNLVAKIKLVFIPKLDLDFTFQITEQQFVGSDGETQPRISQQDYKQIERGKLYAYFLSGFEWCNDITFEVILSNGLTGKGIIKGGCGD